jgi:hypothetical protein
MDEYLNKKDQEIEDQDNIGIYSEEGRKDLMEDEDEITDIDEGFMKGYNEGGLSSKCKSCKTLLEGHKVITKEVKGNLYKFCSQHCLTEFEINNEED